MKRAIALVATLAASGVIGLTANAAHAAAPPSTQDRAFMSATAQTNLAEISVGKLALSRGHAGVIKKLAQKTLSDHRKAQATLTSLAKKANVTLPSSPNAQQQAQATKLKNISAASFDATYAQVQVAGHEKAIAATKKEINAGSDTAVTAFGRHILPILERHLSMARNAVSTLGPPSGVPAGNGGEAATQPAASQLGWQIGLGVGVLLAIAAATTLLLARRSRLTRRALAQPSSELR